LSLALSTTAHLLGEAVERTRKDFDAIATSIVGDDSKDLSGMPLSAIMTDTMRTAFAQLRRNP
jgi:hypothetical protein